MSEKKQINFSGINQRIVEGIDKDANTNAVDRIVNKRVEAEVIRRANLLEKALDKYNTTKKELEKCKPDNVTNVEVDGVYVKHEAWTDKALQAKQKLQKLISVFDIAILNAMSNGDYKRLQELVDGGQKPAKENESAE